MIPRTLLIVLAAASPAWAQDSLVAAHATPSEHPPRFTAGVTSGTMRFSDQRVQEGVTAVFRYHILPSLSIALSPTAARVAFPAALGGGAVSGLTDLPLELSGDHAFDIPWSPTPGISLGASLPIGNQNAGFGTGGVGASVGLGIAVSPADALSLHAGIGKSLDDYSLYSALGSSSSAWGDLEASYQLLPRVEATIGIDGDLAAADSLGPSRALAFAMATNVGGPYTITLSAGHGISGAAARWSIAIGFGSDFAGMQALGSSSPIQRFLKSLGGGSHKGSSSSGHGKGP